MLGTIAGSLISAAANIFGGNAAADAQKEAAALDFKRQMMFAQNQIQWRSEDAKAAGIHPLAALGMGGSQYTGLASSSDPRGAGIAAAGNNIGKALAAASVDTTKAQAELLRAQTQAVLVDTANTVQGHSATSHRVDGNGDISRLPRVNLGDPDGGASTLNALKMEGPSRAIDDTGMTRGHPDTASEAETDLWQWARDGTIMENLNELSKRNLGAPLYGEAEKEVWKWIQKAFNWGSEKEKAEARKAYNWLRMQHR